MRYILIACILLSGIESLAQELIYFEDFSSRKTKLRWAPFPYYFLDNLEIGEEESLGKDNLVGILSNKKVGGFAALSYVLTDPLLDFYVETYIFCQVSNSPKGPLNGIAFLVDPEEGNFYRIVCDFNSENPSLNVAYVGRKTRHFPAYLRFWRNKEIPGGVPKTSSWNKIGIRVKDGRARFYWNGVELHGEVELREAKAGFIGVYANFTGGFGIAETKIENFSIWAPR